MCLIIVIVTHCLLLYRLFSSARVGFLMVFFCDLILWVFSLCGFFLSFLIGFFSDLLLCLQSLWFLLGFLDGISSWIFCSESSAFAVSVWVSWCLISFLDSSICCLSSGIFFCGSSVCEISVCVSRCFVFFFDSYMCCLSFWIFFSSFLVSNLISVSQVTASSIFFWTACISSRICWVVLVLVHCSSCFLNITSTCVHKLWRILDEENELYYMSTISGIKMEAAARWRQLQLLWLSNSYQLFRSPEQLLCLILSAYWHQLEFYCPYSLFSSRMDLITACLRTSQICLYRLLHTALSLVVLVILTTWIWWGQTR